MASAPILLGAFLLVAVRAEEPSGIVAASADLEQTVVTTDGRETVTRSKLFLAGAVARLDVEAGSGLSDYAEFQIYDFERKRFARVFPEDRVYFDLSLSLPQAVRAWLEGWAPAPVGAVVREIPLKDDEVEGVPARLVLVERRLRKDGPTRYAFVWRSVVPVPFPLRVTFSLDRLRTVTVRYRHIETAVLPTDRFSVPEGLANLNPF